MGDIDPEMKPNVGPAGLASLEAHGKPASPAADRFHLFEAFNSVNRKTMNAYNFSPASNANDEVPILISVPHCGTEFPSEIKDQYNQSLIAAPDDTDWFVNNLYDFSTAMGMPMITARYSRWVIDLNRDPEHKPLYTDGRIITSLCPTTTFLGELLYNDNRVAVADDETERRIQLYFTGYHLKIKNELERLRNKFGIALLWDCHSIRQFVKTVHPDKFPDLILGDADGTAASSELTNAALESLGTDNYTVSHNYPFKGGYITRHFGQPSINQHALQLEMTKINYMEQNELEYSDAKAEKMKILLKSTFTSLIQKLTNQSLSSRRI